MRLIRGLYVLVSFTHNMLSHEGICKPWAKGTADNLRMGDIDAHRAYSAENMS